MITLGHAKTPDETRLYAIGDVHGCLDELNRLIDQIFDDLLKNPVAHHEIIFLGDYVDRGPDSAGTFDRLIDLQEMQDNVVCLKGNHEDKLIEFLENPIKLSHSFLKYGGDALARSYGVTPPAMGAREDVMLSFCDALKTAVPAVHIDFTNNLPTKHIAGDYAFVHAGIRPGVPLSEQKERDLMWIRDPFIEHDGPFEKVIVHGHTPCDMPEVKTNRINVDTCAYDTGRLTALVLEGAAYRFLDTA